MMPLVLKDRIRSTTTTTGTGAFSLGSASIGFQAFSEIGDGNTTYYTAQDITGAWEVGIGTYTLSTNSLSRDTVLSSSNGGSLVSFGAGTKDIFVTQPSGRAVYVEGTSVVATNSAKVPNTLLQNSSVTVGSTAISLGGTATTLSGLTSVSSTGFTGALTGNSSTATALQTARNITLSGDTSGTASFNGTADAAITTTLATVNTNIGTFNNVTVNGKGLVTAASNVSYLTGNQTITFSGDASGSGSTSVALTLATVNTNVGTFNNVTVNGKGLVTAASNVSYLTGNQTITFTGDATGSGSTSVALTLANSGVVAGTYTKLTVNAKGLVTTGAALASSDVTTALGYTPYNATNPAGYTTNTGTVTSVSGTGSTNGLTLSGTVTTSGNITLGGSVTSLATNATATTPVFTGQREVRTAVSASDIDLATANFFSKTISGTTTFTVSNVPSTGVAASFILDLTNGGSATVNWWSGVKWAGGTAPTLTTAGRDVLGFFTYDGGTTWTGLVLGKDVK